MLPVPKLDPTVRRETGYIALCVLAGSVLMEAIFLIIGKWDLTVLWGNLLSGAAAVGNFFLMGLSVQSAVKKEEKQAAQSMRMSMALRMVLLFAAAALGVALPCFHIVSSLVPLFFPRIGIALRPLFKGKEELPRES